MNAFKLRILGYVHMFGGDVGLNLQVEALRVVRAAHVVSEPASGTHSARPQLVNLLKELRPGDVVLVPRLDHLARSTRDLLNILAVLADRGAALRSLAEGWPDTTMPEGRQVLAVLIGLADFEQVLRRGRTRQVWSRAKVGEPRMGRSYRLTPHQRREAQARRQASETTTAIARSYGVHHATISWLCADLSDLPASVRNGRQAAELTGRQLGPHGRRGHACTRL